LSHPQTLAHFLPGILYPENSLTAEVAF
jgi:hypothetical protein